MGGGGWRGLGRGEGRWRTREDFRVRSVRPLGGKGDQGEEGSCWEEWLRRRAKR